MDDCNQTTNCPAAPFLASGAVLTACIDNPAPDSLAAVVEVRQSTVLCQDYTNVKFIVTQDNVTLDLCGYTLRNTTNDVTIQVNAGVKNTHITNGNIINGVNAGGVHFKSTLDAAKNTALLANPTVIADQLWAENDTQGSSVSNVMFNGGKTSVFVEAYLSKVTLHNNVFKNNERMAVYLDASSHHNLIENNQFENNGFRHSEPFKRRRGHLSIDGSFDNQIVNNRFVDDSYKWAYVFSLNNYPVPAIELYRNCGETTWGTDVMARLHGANRNQLQGNTFKGTGLAMWFQYREHDNVCDTVIYPDEANDNVATSNTFIGVTESIRDNGTGNSY